MLNFNFIFNLKHIISNEAVKHDFWGTFSFAWKHRRLWLSCGQLNLTFLDDNACDQAIFFLKN